MKLGGKATKDMCGKWQQLTHLAYFGGKTQAIGSSAVPQEVNHKSYYMTQQFYS